jgi:hypothetical protein
VSSSVESMLDNQAERSKHVGSADVSVIEPILCGGLEMIAVKRPTTKGDGDAELIFFVALVVQRSKRGRKQCAKLAGRTEPAKSGFLDLAGWSDAH